MKIFDFNIHLPPVIKEEVTDTVREETEMSTEDLLSSFKNYSADFKDNIQGGNFMLFNQNLFNEEEVSRFTDLAGNELEYCCFTALIDFRRGDIVEYLELAVAKGIRAIKFHSYVQKIADSDFELVYTACKFAEQHNLMICIDASFGTSKMYAHDNLKLACFIADKVSQVPIIILHSGGARVFEAMLLALEKENVYLESSFTLPFYLGSSLEGDLAFAYKKIGAERILYGSDFPYVQLKESISVHTGFFEKYKFTSADLEKIMYNNAMELLADA